MVTEAFTELHDMDILDDDLQAPPHDDHDELTAHPQQPPQHASVGNEHHHHALMDSAAVAALDAAATLSGAGNDDESGVALHDDGDPSPSLQHDASSSDRASNTLAGSKRKKVGKALQLLLLRKYVQCAKQLESLPTRATTEQLLDDGYDEFYLQGGSLSEPRLGYTAFLKLVRNRRGEVMRQTRDLQTLSHTRGSRRHQKERLEIRSLIHELERVRQSHLRSPLDLEALDGSDDASTCAGGVGASSATAASLLSGDPCSVVPAAAASLSHVHSVAGAAAASGATGIDSDVSSGAANSSGSSSLLLSSMAPSSDAVVISRSRLDAMLRFAQETLATQKKILDEVRAIERRLDLHSL